MKIKEAQVKLWLSQVVSEGISFSRMVELINEVKEMPETPAQDKYINGKIQVDFETFGMP